MTPRHVALAVAAVAVLGLGVYLYVAVNSTSTATADVRPRAPEATPSPRDSAPPRQAARTPDRPSVPVSQGRRVNGAIREAAPPPTTRLPPQGPGADIDIKKDEMMASANKAYDHGDFDEAMAIATKVLASDPSNKRMLRVMVSSSCILGDSSTAQRHYLALPAGGNDRADMKKRCDRYGVTFTES